jgi:integrase/recombinase XerD
MRTTETIEKVIDNFLNVLYCQPHSKMIYKSHLSSFVYWCHTKSIDPNEPTEQDMVQFHEYVIRTMQSEYKKSILQTVKRFWTWAYKKNLYHNVCENMRIPRSSDEFTRRPLTEKQAINLIDSIHKDSRTGQRDWIMTVILIETGIRVIELSRIRTQDFTQIGETQGFYYQQKGKTDKNQFKSISNKLYAKIREYIQDFGLDCYDMPLFVSESNSNRGHALSAKAICTILSKRLTTAGLKSKHVSVHSLRHTSGTLASLMGEPMELIAAHLGHSSMKMTKRYTNEALRQRSLQNQIGNKIADILQY